MFVLCKDFKQTRESGNIVKWVFFESIIHSKASSIALTSAANVFASFESRTVYYLDVERPNKEKLSSF